MLVQGLEVDGATWGAVLLGAHHHPVAPGNRLADRYRLQYAELDVAVEASLHGFLPVEGNWNRSVVGNWFCVWVHHQLQRLPVH